MKRYFWATCALTLPLSLAISAPVVSPAQIQRMEQQRVQQQMQIQMEQIRRQNSINRGSVPQTQEVYPPTDVANRERVAHVVVVGYDRSWANESRSQGDLREEGTLYNKLVRTPQTLRDAENMALQACRQRHGARDCHVVARLVNACVAIAKGRHQQGYDKYTERFYVSPLSAEEQAAIARGGVIANLDSNVEARHRASAEAMCKRDRTGKGQAPQCDTKIFCANDNIVWSSQRLPQ